MSLTAAARRLVAAVEQLDFDDPVAFVYDPLVYAWEPHRRYLEQWGAPPKRYLLLGMNPGPFGMAQTGVPFGEVEHVRDWLGIRGRVDRPERCHPKRPIQGFDCPRSEVSGRRLWGYFRERCGTPAAFFRDFWVHNYCPLVFMEEGGRNVTPDKLPAEAKRALFAACDRHLAEVVGLLRPELVIGVGAFAEQRAREALRAVDGLRFGRIPHPSPASPLANRGWDAAADEAFAALGIELGRRRAAGG